jgi:hypothetical protein
MLLVLDEGDNVAVCIEEPNRQDGTKIARWKVAAGSPIRKMGMRIGRASREIDEGETVDEKNLSSCYVDY